MSDPAASPTLPWHRLQRGDVAALGELYDAHAQSLLRFGGRICHDRSLVRDAIQDLFVELWTYHDRLADVENPKFYLFRALRSHLSRYLARRGQSVEWFGQDLAGADAPQEALLIADEAEAGLARRLRAALDRLTPRQRQAVMLRFYEGFSYDETAHLMGISYQATVNLVYKATQCLRQHLRAESPAVADLFAPWLLPGLLGLLLDGGNA